MGKKLESEKIKAAILELFKSKKILAIAVDCGFDGVKICINGKLFTFPSYIFPLNSEEELLVAGQDESDRILYSERFSNKGTNLYAVGSTAKTLINGYPIDGEHQELISNLKNLNIFFNTKEAVYLIRSAISYALVKYSDDNDIGFTLDDLSLFTIYTDLALPHSFLHQAMDSIKGPLSNDTMVNLNVNDKMYSINLCIKSEHISGSSQVLAVFFDLIYDENGKDSYDMEALLNMLPVIIIDGGYRTQGLATIRKGPSLIIQKVSSYEEYSMIEVNKETAKIINDKAMENDVVDYMPIKEYDIDQNIREKKDFVYDVKDNSIERGKRRIKVEFNEIQDIKEHVLKETSKKYCDFLIDTYKIDNVNTIIVAGGTGAAYYEKIKKEVSEYANEVNVILLEDTCDNELLSPVYTIVMGSYKSLLRTILKEVV